MLSYMLDTSLCIRVIRDRAPALRARFNAEADSLCTSTIALAELLYGAARSGDPAEGRRQVHGLLSRCELLAFDADAAGHAADIRASLAQRGLLLGSYDLFIAGHARSRGLTVVTGNIGEFSRVAGLRCEDWLASSPGVAA